VLSTNKSIGYILRRPNSPNVHVIYVS